MDVELQDTPASVRELLVGMGNQYTHVGVVDSKTFMCSIYCVLLCSLVDLKCLVFLTDEIAYKKAPNSHYAQIVPFYIN